MLCEELAAPKASLSDILYTKGCIGGFPRDCVAECDGANYVLAISARVFACCILILFLKLLSILISSRSLPSLSSPYN